MPTEADKRALERALRVADQMCSAYAKLRDRYAGKALALDLAVLLISTWLVAMTFAEPALGNKLSPPGIQREIWIGLLSIGVFLIALVQLRVDWKSRTDRYQRALVAYSAFVRANRRHRAEGSAVSNEVVQSALASYQNIGDWAEPISDKCFLALKKHHQIKVEISRHLDSHPGASIWLLRLRLLWRDNCRRRS
jgi:hypothetical protein